MTLPLHNQHIVITRAAEQAIELAERLRILGAEPLICPAIGFAPPEEYASVDAALYELAEYDWLLFTSANAVRFTLSRLQQLAIGLEILQHTKVGVVGPATAQALCEYGVQATLIANDHSAEGLLKAIEAWVEASGLQISPSLTAQRMLLPATNLARDTLADGLRQHGTCVEQVIAYRTIPGEGGVRLAALVRNGIQIDATIFSSPSAVQYLLQGLQEAGMSHDTALNTLGSVICIGTTTAEAARQVRLVVARVAATPTVDGLVEAVLEHVDNVQLKTTTIH